MKLMSQKQEFNDSSYFKFIEWDEFIKYIGSTILENQVIPLLGKTLNLIENHEGSMIVAQNIYDDSFAVYDEVSNNLVLTIQKDKNSEYFCSPILALDFLRCNALINFEDEIDDYEINLPLAKEFIYDILYQLNQLPDNEKLSNYLYDLSVVILAHFDLDYINSSIMHFDTDSILLDGIKTESVCTKNSELSTQQVSYMISLDQLSDEIKLVKVYENNSAVTQYFKVIDFILGIDLF